MLTNTTILFFILILPLLSFTFQDLPLHDRPNYAFTHLAALSKRISGMEKDQIATIEALDKLLVAVGVDEEDWKTYRLSKDAQNLGWRYVFCKKKIVREKEKLA